MSVIGTCETCGGETVDYTCSHCQHDKIEQLTQQLDAKDREIAALRRYLKNMGIENPTIEGN